jgi:hypothetical protein
MKRLISLILVVTMLFSSPALTFAADDKGDAELSIAKVDVEYSDNIGNIEKLTLMESNGNVYVSANEIAERLGYESFYGSDRNGDFVCVRNMNNDAIQIGFTKFYFDSTDVQHMLFTQIVNSYQAPFESIRNGEDAWIPFEYALLILGSAKSVIDNTILIDMPQTTIVDVFYALTKNDDKYNFDWNDDFGYTDFEWEAIGASSHLVNLFNGILKSDGDSWAEMFESICFSNSSAYDSKYGEKMAVLLCTESDKELEAEAKKIKKCQDLLSSDGKIGKMLSKYSQSVESDLERCMQTCDQVMEEVKNGNALTVKYNRSYQALEKAFDKETWFSDTGGTILEVQKGVKEATPFVSAALTIAEVVGYAQEFQKQDEYTVDALYEILQANDKNEIIPSAMKRSIKNYVDTLQSDIIKYSAKRYFDKNIDGWLKKGVSSWLGKELGVTELLGTTANIELLAWSLATTFIPWLSDNLSAADKFELALYTSIFNTDTFLKYQEKRNKVFSNEAKITAENLYTVSQYCYIYLKSCFVEREAALASLKGKTSSVQEQIQPLIDEQNAINKEISDLLVVLKDADTTNDNLIYGFLPEDNRKYLNSFDNTDLLEIVTKEGKKIGNEELYQAYYDKLMELQQQYGYGVVIRDDYQSWLSGLCFAKLIDFDQDGQEELMLAYCSGVENNDPEYVMELWGNSNGEIQKLFEGDCWFGEELYASVKLYYYDEQYLFEHSLSVEDYSKWSKKNTTWQWIQGSVLLGLKENEIIPIHMSLFGYNSDMEKIIYQVDGVDYSEEEMDEYRNNSQSTSYYEDSETFWLMWDVNGPELNSTLTELENTLTALRDYLGISTEEVKTYTDWKQAYADYLQEIEQEHNTNSSRANYEYYLFDIDSNNIPEVLVEYGTVARGEDVFTYDGNQVNTIHTYNYGVSYIPGENLFCDSGGRMDGYYDKVYKIEDGKFVECGHGDYGAEDNAHVQLDENGEPIYKYYWNDQEVDKDTYTIMFHNLYNTSLSCFPYDSGALNYREVLAAIASY